MPRLSLWKEGRRTDDYKFIDRTCNEMFTAGGTSIIIHKYLGPSTGASVLTVSASQSSANTVVTIANTSQAAVGQWVFGTGIPSDTKIGAKTTANITLTNATTQALTANSEIWINSVNDPTKPVYTSDNPLNIQDLLLLENRDRKYDTDIYDLRGVYNVQDLDFDLSQFGLFLQNDTVFVTFHLNDMVQRLGRKVMSGDVLELPHLKDFYSLDETIPVALKRFYVVKDAIRSAEGYSPTWWPHLWRVKATPLVDSQEYKSILNQLTTGNTNLGNLISSSQVYTSINDAIIASAEIEVPRSGYDTTPYWIPPQKDGDKLHEPMDPELSPDEIYGGYLVEDIYPPNGIPVTAGITFPAVPTEGEYFLRTDFRPNRMFVYKGDRWIKVQDAVRTNITPGTGNTLRDTFINNTATFTNSQGGTEPSKQNLSDLLGPESDY